MLKCFYGYLKEEGALLQSASGGLARAIAEEALSRGELVYGVAYSEDFRSAQYVCVDNASDLTQLCGTKYIRSSKILKNGENVYLSVAKAISSGRMVTFFGLSCDVAALQSVLNKRNVKYDQSLFTVDLICHGPTSPDVAKQFIDELEKRYRSKVVGFSVRYKNPNWVPPYLRAVFENGNEYCEEFYKTDYGTAFLLYSLPGCYHCVFKGENHKSDITIGDFWGIRENDIGFNSKGVSVALIHNERAEKLLRSLKDFVLFEGDVEKALKGNPRYDTSTAYSPEHERFAKDFRKYGLKIACKRAAPPGQALKNALSKWLVDILVKIKS